MESSAQYPGALVNLGFAGREQGRINEAREVLERAVRIAHEDADSQLKCDQAQGYHSADPCRPRMCRRSYLDWRVHSSQQFTHFPIPPIQAGRLPFAMFHAKIV
jgi:hypothetical protein